MFITETSLRVRYAETDQMGYVYYGNYATYYEVARTEAIRALGLPYKNLEQEERIMMPVLENYTKYIKPAVYDDLLRIIVKVPQKPGVRMRFEYEIYNEQDQLLNTGYTVLVFVNIETGRPCRMPDGMAAKMEPYFRHESARKK